MSEAELCKLFEVSRVSARRALDELRKEGYIVRIVGKGNFVTFKPIVQRLQLKGRLSLTEEILRRGMRPSIRLIQFERNTLLQVHSVVGARLKKGLLLEWEDEVYSIRTVRHINDEIIAFDITYLPCKYFPSLTGEEIQAHQSIYRVLEKKYNCRPTHAEEEFFARSITPQLAQYLDMTPGAATLQARRIGYHYDKPIELTMRYYKGERYSCMLEYPCTDD